MKLTCPCGEVMPLPARGRIPTYCSSRCRVAAHRKRRKDEIPAELRSVRRWTRRGEKRPIMVDGRPASSTDPNTWTSFAAAQAGSGDGFGIMLGDGLGCYDLDHVTDEDVRRFVEAVTEPIIYTERSMSGEGVHVFIAAPEAPGWKRKVDGVSVERYTRARFIAVTGKVWRA